MSELAFQTAFAKLLIDGELRSMALAGSPLPGLELSDADAARLRELDRERVEVYAELLVMNRLAKAVEALPLTTKALGEQLWPLTLAWSRACPPVQARKYDEAMAFGRYLQGTMGSRPDEPSYLHDLLLYEMSRIELRYTAVHASPSTVMEGSPASIAALARSGGADVYPRRVPHARMLAFDHDIESIIAELEQGRVPLEAEPHPSHVLMVADGTGRVQPFAANLPTAAFVSAATGAQSFAEVLAWLAEVFQQEEAEAFQALVASCVELCMSLVEQGVIVLSDHPVGRDAERMIH